MVLRRPDKSLAPAGPDWSKATNIQLTEQAQGPSISLYFPDGKSFVFAADHGGNFDIYSQRVGGRIPTNLTRDSPASDTQPAFSPDGELIAFRSRAQRDLCYGCDRRGLRGVSDFGFHPSFSPDGKELVVSAFYGFDQPTVRHSIPGGIWIVNIETGLKREISKLDGSFPTWSPNGKHVAFWTYPDVAGRRDIAVVGTDAFVECVITRDFAVSNWNPVWAPDGKSLYFVSDRNGNLSFWRVGIDEMSGEALGEPEPAAAPSKYSRHLNFSRDGRRMVYVQTNNQANIRAVAFDAASGKTTGDPFWVTRGDREVTRAELSADGTQFLMWHNRGSRTTSLYLTANPACGRTSPTMCLSTATRGGHRMGGRSPLSRTAAATTRSGCAERTAAALDR